MSDLGEHVSGAERDQLAFRSHADALARLIAARATATPLAVAVLAEWGGGKSAFLRLLGDAVERLAASGDPDLAGRISVVRFNAWHRSDRSVLVGIFDRVVEAFREHDGDERASRRDGARRRARRRAAAVGWIERLDEREERLEHDAGRPAAGPLAALGRRLRLVALVPWALVQGSWRSATLLTTMLVVAVALVAGPFVLPVIAPGLAGWLNGAEAWVNGALASSGVAALVTALVAVYRIRVNRTRDAEGEEPGTLAGLIAATIDQERDRAEARIAEIDAEDATRGIADLVHDGDHRARLDAARGFVGHLGSELGAFAEQVAQAEAYWRRARRDGGGGTDRVVLLVDDLDRCTPARVVEVLHALAMLQYTSLFAVVVAADPRWLRRCVETAGDVTGTEGSHLEGYVDDAVDYLDAAFHVPFTVPRTLRSDGGQYLLATAAEHGLLPAPLDTAPTGTAPAGTAPAAQLPDPAAAFTAAESRMLAAVSGALTSPRAVKKFLVLYRLVRLGTHLPDHARFLDEDGDHRQVALLLALLVGAPGPAALVLRELSDAADDEPLTDAAADEPLTDVVAALAAGHATAGHDPCADCTAWRRARTAVARAIDAGAPAAASRYRRWAPEIARFSFRTEATAA